MENTKTVLPEALRLVTPKFTVDVDYILHTVSSMLFEGVVKRVTVLFNQAVRASTLVADGGSELKSTHEQRFYESRGFVLPPEVEYDRLDPLPRKAKPAPFIIKRACSDQTLKTKQHEH